MSDLSSLSGERQLRRLDVAVAPELAAVIEYRKSGLSINHVVGCPLDCGYCVRHLFSNFDMKRPRLVMSDEEATELLVGHWAFRAHATPIQIFNRATDPLLPNVKRHLFNSLQLLDQRGLTNPVLIITRWKVDEDDIAMLDQLSNLRVTVLVTWSGIADQRIEPVESAIAEQSLENLSRLAARTRKILYWRPIVAGLNDTCDHIARASRLSSFADATVFTGMFHRDEIREYLRSTGVEDLYAEVARRKIMPRELESKILAEFSGRNIFRKTSCGVAFAHRTHDYNGHFGVKGLCDICPGSQVEICAAVHATPSRAAAERLAETAGLDPATVSLGDGCLYVADSTEQQRYFMQHSLAFQVHDRALPHLPGRHGRAETGWQ